MKSANVSSLLNAANADKAMAWLVAAAILLVIILLARAVGRLSKLARIAAAPVAAPKSGGRGKLLLLAGAGGAGYWAYVKARHPAAAAKAAPAPVVSPSPVPHPTVTQTVTPHVPHVTHFFLTGGDVVALYIIGAVVAIVVVGQVLRRLT